MAAYKIAKLSRATALFFYALFMLLNGPFFFLGIISKKFQKKFKNFKIFLNLGGAKTRFLRNIYEKVKDGGHWEYR